MTFLRANIYRAISSELISVSKMTQFILQHTHHMIIELGLEAVPMKKTIAEYYQTNIVQTTSAVFSEPLLDFHISQIGADRILFSIDYPWQTLADGANFMHGVKLDAKTKAAIGTNNAIDVLRLDR